MSGHSKWATIKRQKGANDAKRGAVFTKLSNAIAIAVRQGGGIGDPDQNFRLRLAVDAARAANMPKENIERAIQRAQGSGADENVEEVMYEGFGPSGVCLIIEAVTNNKNRTVGEVKNIFDKTGGTLGQPGSVSYQFKQVGQIIINKAGKLLDDIFLDIAEAGAEDIEEVGEEVFIYSSPSDLTRVRSALSAMGYVILEMEIVWKPITLVTVSEEDPTAQKVITLIDRLENLDDVQKVYSNFEIL